MIVVPLRPRIPPRNCHASGWAVAAAATSGANTMTCPWCGQTVPAIVAPKLGARVRVIARHPSPDPTGPVPGPLGR